MLDQVKSGILRNKLVLMISKLFLQDCLTHSDHQTTKVHLMGYILDFLAPLSLIMASST